MVNVVILASRSSREVKSPRRSSRRASTPNHCSTMLSQDACFGVYVTSNRGWAVSQVRGDHLGQHVQEPGEGGGVAAVDALGDDLAGGDVHGGEEGDGAVAGVLELPPGVAAGNGGDLRVLAGILPGCRFSRR